MDISRLNVDQDLFLGEKIGEILMLSFKGKPLLHVTDLDVKKALFDYLELVACCDEIKALLIKEAPTKMRRAEYIAFYKNLIRSGFAQKPLSRMYNAINQFILMLMDLNKMVIHADSGNVILLFMNISLACDYRIVADNTVYQNPNIELGVVPKGGSVFFLSKMLGTVTASRILLSGEDVTAIQAHQLGIVDKVVPLEDLDRIALETARSYAQLPSGYSIGIKKLLNFDLKELNHYLEFENQLLRRQVCSCHLRNFGRLKEKL
ncbi:MAG: enoyl-CoA hydratase/isomerase family protein [Deltaproteobacteria bacterium]|nr:enoyl-CoA hydratase/isomerase family protein [Deltaproteobacteria bacterium]